MKKLTKRQMVWIGYGLGCYCFGILLDEVFNRSIINRLKADIKFWERNFDEVAQLVADRENERLELSIENKKLKGQIEKITNK